MEFSAEEQTKLLSLLDDGTKASIGTMFIGREVNGVISMDQLTEMMTELQVAFDPEMLSKVVSEDNWDRIELEQSMLIIAYCIDAAQKQVAQQAKADSAVVVAQAAQPVVYLNTFEYLVHLTPCATKEEGVEYRWNKVKLDVRPKTILMVSVAVMMVLAAIALISATIGLNERATQDQSKEALDHLATTVDTSTLVLLDEAVRSVVADSLRSTSQVTASVSEGLLLAHQEVVMEQLKVSLTQASSAFVSVAEEAADDRTQQLAAKVDTVSILFQAETKDALIGFAKDALTHGTMIFLSDSSGTLVTPSICSGSTPSFAKLLATSSEGTEQACGTHIHYACSFIYNSGTRVCIVETRNTRHDHQRMLLDEVVTEINSLRSESSIELQAALEPEVEDAPFVSVGGRKKLPMLCIRSQECTHAGQEIFQWASNSTETGTRIVTGYDTSSWLAAYNQVELESQAILFGLKEDVEESKSRFFTSLGEGSSKNRNATLSPLIVFAVADSLERVELLPINETAVTAAQDTYLSYALNGRQGISYPTVSDVNSLMSGYSSAMAGDLAVGIEYTAAEVSTSSTDFVIQTLAAINSKLPTNWEILAVKEVTPGEIEYVIPLKRSCPVTGCLQHTAIQRALGARFGGRVDEGTDYAGGSFSGWYLYYNQAPPFIVVVQYSSDQLTAVILQRRYIALGVGIAIIVAVQLIILLLTRRVLDRIENDYNKYKRQIEDEKHQFSELVKDVMPPYIAERIMKGTRLIAETHPQLTFFFSDIVGSTESSKTMTNKGLVRMLGYSFMLEDEIANYFGVHKIKTIGDAYFAVSGLEDNLAGGATQGKDHQVYRMASFACICQQLFGPTYQHHPERTECFRISSGGAKLEPMKMVRMRMGIHTGPAVAGVVDVGRAPHFDCFGPSVNLASRMESTSAPGRVQISGPTYEILSKLDKDGLFEYEAPRKTLVKGFGTMVTYMVKSTTLPIPETLIDRLFIERANQRQFFAAQHALAAEVAADLARAEAEKHHSDKGSAEKGDEPPQPTTPPSMTQPGAIETTPAPVAAPVEQQPTSATTMDPLPSLLSNLAPFHGYTEPPTVTDTRPTPVVVPAPQQPAAAAAPVQMPGFQGFAMAMPPPPPPPDF